MKFHFTYHTTAQESKNINDFLSAQLDFPPEHRDEWFKLNNPDKKSCVFYGEEDGVIQCYSLIKENYRIATVFLGPLFSSTSSLTAGIEAIQNHYLKKGFGELIGGVGSKAQAAQDFAEITSDGIQGRLDETPRATDLVASARASLVNRCGGIAPRNRPRGKALG